MTPEYHNLPIEHRFYPLARVDQIGSREVSGDYVGVAQHPSVIPLDAEIGADVSARHWLDQYASFDEKFRRGRGFDNRTAIVSSKHGNNPRCFSARAACTEGSLCVESFSFCTAKPTSLTLFHVSQNETRTASLAGVEQDSARSAPGEAQSLKSFSSSPPRGHSQQAAEQTVSEMKT